MPKFSIRSIGDPISSLDDIVFESVLSPGHYITFQNVDPAVADAPTWHTIAANCSELTLSVSRSSFNIGTYHRPDEFVPRRYGDSLARELHHVKVASSSIDQSSAVIEAGMMIQLHHKVRLSVSPCLLSVSL